MSGELIFYSHQAEPKATQLDLGCCKTNTEVEPTTSPNLWESRSAGVAHVVSRELDWSKWHKLGTPAPPCQKPPCQPPQPLSPHWMKLSPPLKML